MDFPDRNDSKKNIEERDTIGKYNVYQKIYCTSFNYSMNSNHNHLNKMPQFRFHSITKNVPEDGLKNFVDRSSYWHRNYEKNPYASYRSKQWIACSNSRKINQEILGENGSARESKQWIGFVSGLIAGMIGTLTGHPFDTLKTRMQVYGNMNYGGISEGKRKQGRGRSGKGRALPYDALVKIRRLYAGVLPPLVTTGLIQTINFGVYDNTLKYLKQKEKERNQGSRDEEKKGSKSIDIEAGRSTSRTMSSSSYSCFNHFLAGAAGGTSITLITCPSSLIKIQLQLSKDKGYGIRDIFQRALYLTIPNRSIKIGGAGSSGQTLTLSLFSQGPHTILYRALLPDFIAQSMGRGVYMYTYEYSKRLLLQYSPTQLNENKKSDLSLYQRILAGGLAGITGWLSIYPIDVIKSRLQADALSREHKRHYKGLVDCFLKTYNSGGLKGLYSGLGYTLLRAVPVASVILPSYDFVYRLLEEKFAE